MAEIRSKNPEGTVLYSFGKMRTPAPLRRFVFVNRYDEEPGKANLVVLAKGFEVSSLDG